MEPRQWRYDDLFGFSPYSGLPHYPDWRQYRNVGKRRAGFTKNKRQGQSKTKRLMAKQSRRINRGKR